MHTFALFVGGSRLFEILPVYSSTIVHDKVTALTKNPQVLRTQQRR
jgi:hypothetical protein